MRQESDPSRKLAPCAVWYNASAYRRSVQQGLESLWAHTYETYDLQGGDPSCFQPYLQVGPSLLLALVGDFWSPGDIAGFLRGRELIPASCEIVALRLDREWYIPHHGLNDCSRRQVFADWYGQLRTYSLGRR